MWGNCLSVFYVSQSETVCFPDGKRMFLRWKTYVSALGNIE